MTPFPPGALPEFTPTERQIDRIEESWADCAAGMRLAFDGVRQTRRNGMTQIRCLNLLAVHELLEVHRKRYEQGDVSALYDSMRQCMEENLPLPYWAAQGMLEVMQRVGNEPGLSLHGALGLDVRHPLTPQKSITSRRDWKVACDLWGLVRVHQKEHGSSLDSAIAAVRAARPDIAAKVGKRKAHDLYHWVDDVQTPALTAIRRSR